MSRILTTNYGNRHETHASRKLRREQTPAEKRLWKALRRNQFEGLHFRRQQPLGGYYADFFCASVRLVVELDGVVHRGQEGYDRARDAWMRSAGFVVVRYANEQVIENLAWVLDDLRRIVGEQRTK